MGKAKIDIAGIKRMLAKPKTYIHKKKPSKRKFNLDKAALARNCGSLDFFIELTGMKREIAEEYWEEFK